MESAGLLARCLLNLGGIPRLWFYSQTFMLMYLLFLEVSKETFAVIYGLSGLVILHNYTEKSKSQLLSPFLFNRPKSKDRPRFDWQFKSISHYSFRSYSVFLWSSRFYFSLTSYCAGSRESVTKQGISQQDPTPFWSWNFGLWSNNKHIIPLNTPGKANTGNKTIGHSL